MAVRTRSVNGILQRTRFQRDCESLVLGSHRSRAVPGAGYFPFMESQFTSLSDLRRFTLAVRLCA
jgi:hypothetical protein